MLDTADDMPWGREQLVYRVNAFGEALGLTTAELGSQLRTAFDGRVVQVHQAGADEVEVRVQLPREQRERLATLSSLAVRLPDWHLDVVGDGDLLPALQAEAARTSVPRITFHGRQVSEPFFRRAAIFVMTSEFEGFPNTLVEAQSRGAIPVVFDSYPVARWLVDDGKNGVLAPTGDLVATEAALINLCQSPQRRTTMAQAALDAADRFTEARVAGKWQALLDEVTAAGKLTAQ